MHKYTLHFTFAANNCELDFRSELDDTKDGMELYLLGESMTAAIKGAGGGYIEPAETV